MTKMKIDAELLRELGWQQNGDVWTHPLTRGQYDLTTAIEVTDRVFAGYTGNQDPDWEPGEQDIAWQKQLMARLPHGALWQTSEGKFKVYQNEREAVLLSGDPGKGLIKQIIAVFKVMGWTVIVKKGEDNEPLQSGEAHFPDVP